MLPSVIITVLLSTLLSGQSQGVPLKDAASGVFSYSEPLAAVASAPTTQGLLPRPRILSEGQVFRTEVGGGLTLPCRVKDLGPMVLLWKKGSRVLTAGSMQVRRDPRISLTQDTNLHISEVTQDDAGEYLCEVETDDLEPMQIVHSVEILVPPTISTQPSNGQIVVKKGTSVTLTCLAHGNPQPRLRWGKAHDQLPKSEVSDNGATLTLTDVTRHHAGKYQCHASNGVGKDAKAEITLDILYEPEVKSESAIVHAGVGYQVELVCVVYAEPVSDVLWYKDTMLLDSNGRRYMQKKGNRYTLLIRTVEEQDFGNYSCSASNMLGKARAHLTVQGNPNTPVFNSRVDSKSRTSYKLSWITESYSTIQQYRLLYRKLPDDPSQDVFYAYNNVVIDGVGTQGYEHHQSYILDNLMPDSMYEAQIQAMNIYGWSQVSDKFQFYTRAYDTPPIESSVKNPASAPFGINAAVSSSSTSAHWLSLVLSLALALRWHF